MSRLTERELRLIEQARETHRRGPTFEADASPTTDGSATKVSPHRARPTDGPLYRAVIDNLVKPIFQAAKRRRTIEQLRGLDDRMLLDIGLTRQAIGQVVYEQTTTQTSDTRRQGGVFAAIKRLVDREASVHHLQSLDDRQLADIGVPRYEIENFVSGSATHGNTGLWQRFKQWRARQASIRQLQSLDNRVLADIGVHRTDIPEVVKQGQRRPAERAVQGPTSHGVAQGNGAARSREQWNGGSHVKYDELIEATKWIPEVIAVNARAAVAKRQSW